MPIESVLTTDQKASFVIERFIFHVIRIDEKAPLYLEEIDLTTDQEQFFKARFTDVAEGKQFCFEHPRSDFKDNCQQLLKDPDKHFVEVSQNLASAFKSEHNKSMNDGAFIVSLVSVSGVGKLIFLLKIDHYKVYEYKIGAKHRDSNAVALHKILNNFVEDKKAIQKAALVDASNYYSWDVLATDRTASGGQALSVYFAQFLSVREKDESPKLTEDAARMASRWAITNIAEIDPLQDPSAYKGRAITYLESKPRFNTAEFISAVIADDDIGRKEKLEGSFKAYLDQSGFSGQVFAPYKPALTKNKRKSVRQTEEGVKIEWEGDASAVNLDIPREKSADGYFHITIKTRSIKNIDPAK